jgi:hypothetical protein
MIDGIKWGITVACFIRLPKLSLLISNKKTTLGLNVSAFGSFT